MEGFLGIDVSKHFLDACLSVGVSDEERILCRVSNQKVGFRMLLKEAKKAGIKKLYVCMEATGDFWKELALFLSKSKMCSVFVVNPARIKAQRRTEQKRSKTDKIDAGVITRFLKANLSQLHAWSPPSASIIELQDLVRFREILVVQRATLKIRRKHNIKTKLIFEIVERQIEELTNSIDDLEIAIQETIEKDSNLRKQARSAESVPGIGLITTAIILSECRAFNEIKKPRQATAFAGLDVVEDSSGQSTKPPRISRQGSSMLRKAMVCAASSSIRSEGVFKDFYFRLREKGMKKKPALVAVARKLLEVTVAIVVSEQTFQKDHRNKNKKDLAA